MITVQQLIEKIETRQNVLNKNDLSEFQLASKIHKISSLEQADKQSLSFLAQDKYLSELADSQVGVILITQDKLSYLKDKSDCIALVVQSPYLAYASCSQLFDKTISPSIHPTAIINKTAKIGENVTLGAYSVIGANTQIGNNTIIENHVTIAENCQIGANAIIKSNVVIAEQSQLGDNVRIHSGASIGSEGFGFAPTANLAEQGWERIAQLGRVIIGNHVRIGANTTIDRGAISDTIIADNVIIDNLVQIAHNVQIGKGTAIASKTGIAGSTKIGKNCIIGGAVGITGHIEICDNVTITGMSLISKSITKSGSYSSGMPAIASPIWRRAVVKLRKLAKG
ncbi:MAG: UDP-3-O-(3-hydroxymyristoyl)glucosamine N-acyltransferase [Moraxellaceae bacterium]|nr:UDP-3-O-(3-hydroxymyristoyl)glucosamine N-acyltransferase [Moraxellaceae bacterium]